MVTETRHCEDLRWQTRCWKVSAWLIAFHNSLADFPQRHLRHPWLEDANTASVAPNDGSWQKVPWQKDHHNLQHKDLQSTDLYVRIRLLSSLTSGNNHTQGQMYCKHRHLCRKTHINKRMHVSFRGRNCGDSTGVRLRRHNCNWCLQRFPSTMHSTA